MAVLSQPTVRARASSGHSCVVVSLGAAETQARIKATLEEHNTEVELLLADGPEETIELELDAEAIVVLVCDVDRPQQMATLRGRRRPVAPPRAPRVALRERAIVVAPPAATATGVRRALDAGADAVVFEPEL